MALTTSKTKKTGDMEYIIMMEKNKYVDVGK